LELDLVITWVDGSDQAWLAEFERVSKAYNFTMSPKKFEQRFDSYDDLSVALDSFERFASSVFRKVWIVHDPIQIPEVRRDYISFVSHAEIIPSEDLPLFNSYAIEPYIHRIPGLSEHFVYANDDFFFLEPVSQETFFDGLRPKMFAERPCPPLEELEGIPRELVAWQFAVARTNQLLNKVFNSQQDPNRYLRIIPAHVHVPLTKSICEAAWGLFGHYLREQSRIPFRCLATERGEVVASTNMLFPWVGLELGLAVMSSVPQGVLGYRPSFLYEAELGSMGER
jgi:hypothetical protein